ncbi:MAG: hypothetical protein KDA54_07180 [Phycisphaerales bacterium]|nr:hypothetical protein [Phycisphaerales bacterium]
MPTTPSIQNRRMALIALCVAFAIQSTAHAAEVTLFSDDFDSGTSATHWSTISDGGDFTADFAFDYSTRGIAPAPNTTGGTTIGMHLTVNSTDATPALDAVNAYLNSMTFEGDYILRFDMWLNYNGGAGGGTGSTQFALIGVGHSAAQSVWANSPTSDGHWFGITGEGGDSNDYRAYRGAQLLSVDESTLSAISRNHTDVFYQTFFTSPTYESQGAPGKHWVEVEVSYIAGVLEWHINGRLFAIREEPNIAPGAIMLGLMDTFTSIASPATDTFALFDNVRVVAPDCDNNAQPDFSEIAADPELDCNSNDFLDTCETLSDGDFDDDGDVDLTDFDGFVDCLAGPDILLTNPSNPCEALCLQAFDNGGDDAVDLADFSAFQRSLTISAIPPRPAGAPTGTQLAAEIAGLSRVDREARILAEITSGNVPGFLREFVPINVSRVIASNTVNATYFVSNDYLSAGIERDFVRMPMSPLIAQPIADAFDCLLPTRRMVNDIYTQATTKLAPQPISPTTTDIARMTTMLRHHRIVEGQQGALPLTNLIGGIKKDVVITTQLPANPNKVAIYGWHQLNGSPIQPLYLGHVDFYADYSHGIRLVYKTMIVDGVEMPVAQVLADPQLNVLISDEGVLTSPSY